MLLRYWRSTIGTALVVFLLGALLAVLITTSSGASESPQGAEQQAAVTTSRSTVLIRPVLCYAYPYDASQSKSGPLPACGAPYEQTTANLKVRPGGLSSFATNNVDPDPGLTGYQNSTRDIPGQTVLLGGFQRIGAQRYLLGPSEMRLNAANVSSVVAEQDRHGQWIVKILLTPAVAATWDRVARENFHQFLAIDMNGVVVSAPIIQPTYASFKSFKGSMGVSGGLTAANARSLAAAVKS
jgi:hypothetical protein